MEVKVRTPRRRWCLIGADVSSLEKAWDPDSEEESASHLACSDVSGRGEWVQRGSFYELEILQTGLHCCYQKELPVRKWRNMSGMTLVRTTNRQEAHRKQQVVDRKEQVPSSSSSLSVPLALPKNRLQEVH